jgi:acetyl-CoA acyltransferase
LPDDVLAGEAAVIHPIEAPVADQWRSAGLETVGKVTSVDEVTGDLLQELRGKLGQGADRAVQITACSVACGPLGAVADYTRMDVTAAAASRCYSATGWDATDIQIAEVHDCFSITEALICEALGFCQEGEGMKIAADGVTSLEGSLPINSGGGLMAFGHPVGATGVKQLFDIYRLMIGFCGDYPVATAPERGLCANMGGDDRTSVVTLLERK